MIDSSENELKVSQEIDNESFKKQEDILQKIIEQAKEKLDMFSSEQLIKNPELRFLHIIKALKNHHFKNTQKKNNMIY